MENQFFRCTQRAITQRRVITLGPIFIKMVLNRAQGLKKKSQKVSARKNNNRQRYNKTPALLGLRNRKNLQIYRPFFSNLFDTQPIGKNSKMK